MKKANNVRFNKRNSRIRKQAKCPPMKISQWAKFLADDHDDDWEHILHVLAYKLRRTRTCLARRNSTTRITRIKHQIMAVESLIDRVLSHDYAADKLAAIKRKYGKPIRIKGEPIKGGAFNGMIPITLAYEKATTGRRLVAARKRTRKALDRADEERQRDLDNALALLAKNIQGWWG